MLEPPLLCYLTEERSQDRPHGLSLLIWRSAPSSPFLVLLSCAYSALQALACAQRDHVSSSCLFFSARACATDLIRAPRMRSMQSEHRCSRNTGGRVDDLSRLRLRGLGSGSLPTHVWDKCPHSNCVSHMVSLEVMLMLYVLSELEE